MNTVRSVVAAVNQALPNADPAVKSMVARELIENTVKGQEQEQNADFNRLYKQSMLGINKQRADADTTRADASASNASGGWDPEDVEYAAARFRATGTMPALGMGGATVRKQIISAARKQAEAEGKNGEADAYKALEYKAASSAAQTAGRSGGQVDVSSRLLDNTIPLAKAAIAKVDLSSFPDYNAFHNFALRHTGDPNIAAADAALQAVGSDYGMLLVRNGQSTDASRATAQTLANMQMSPEALNALFGQIEKESKAARSATQDSMSNIGKPPGTSKGSTDRPSDDGSGINIPSPPPGFTVMQ